MTIPESGASPVKNSFSAAESSSAGSTSSPPTDPATPGPSPMNFQQSGPDVAPRTSVSGFNADAMSAPATFDGMGPAGAHAYGSPHVARAIPAMPAVPLTKEMIKQRLMGPAIGMLICSILGLLSALFWVMMYSFILINPPRGHFHRGDDEVVFIIMIAMGLFWVITSLVVVFGSWAMLRAEKYKLAMAACIITLIPFVTILPFCGFPYAFAIWGLIVLCNPEVKAAYEDGAPRLGTNSRY